MIPQSAWQNDSVTPEQIDNAGAPITFCAMIDTHLLSTLCPKKAF